MPLPTSLVVKKGSKILARTSAWNAVAGVLDLYQHVVGRNDRHLLQVTAVGSGEVAGAQRDLAAVADGVAGIDDQIDDHLLELVEVGLHLPKVAPIYDVELDRLADQAAKQHLQLRQHVVELQRLGTQASGDARRRAIAAPAGRPIGVLLDLHDVLEGRIGRAVIGEQKIGIADDCGQHVVEVVRDAAGELADGLHLLALDQVLLERALLGGVEGEDGCARALVGLRIGRRDEEARRTRGARRLQQHVERSDVALALGGGLDRSAQGGAIALGDQVEDRQPSLGGVGLERGLGEPRKGGVGTQHRALGVNRRDRHRCRIENAGKSNFRRAQVFALDVARRAVDDQRARRAWRSVAGKGNLVEDAHRQHPALARLEVDVELLR